MGCVELTSKEQTIDQFIRWLTFRIDLSFHSLHHFVVLLSRSTRNRWISLSKQLLFLAHYFLIDIGVIYSSSYSSSLLELQQVSTSLDCFLNRFACRIVSKQLICHQHLQWPETSKERILLLQFCQLFKCLVEISIFCESKSDIVLHKWCGVTNPAKVSQRCVL